MSKNVSSAKKHAAAGHKSNLRNPIAVVAISLVIGITLLIGSAALFSFLLKGNSSPESFFPLASLACALISGSGAGIAAARHSGSRMHYSLISGMLMLALFLAVSAAFEAEQVNSSTAFKAIIAAVTVISSGISGALAVRKKSAGKKARR